MNVLKCILSLMCMNVHNIGHCMDVLYIYHVYERTLYLIVWTFFISVVHVLRYTTSVIDLSMYWRTVSLVCMNVYYMCNCMNILYICRSCFNVHYICHSSVNVLTYTLSLMCINILYICHCMNFLYICRSFLTYTISVIHLSIYWCTLYHWCVWMFLITVAHVLTYSISVNLSVYWCTLCH